MLTKSKKPSAFVSYTFSIMGSAEWPPHENSDPFELEQAHSIGDVPVPNGVKFYPVKKNMAEMQQLVLIGDDDAWKLRVEGYTDPKKTPVLVEKWSFPKFAE